MTVTVESLEKLKRRVLLSIPKQTVLSEVEKRLKNLAPRIRLDGFRPGKAPLKLVRQMYSGNVTQEVLGDEVNRVFREAVKEADIKLAGYPNFDVNPDNASNDFAFTATFEVLPQVPPADFAALELEHVSCAASDADVNDTLQTMRQQRRTFVARSAEHPEGAAARHGDRVTFLHHASHAGTPLPEQGGTQTVVLGESTDTALVERLQGVVAGQQLSYTLGDKAPAEADKGEDEKTASAAESSTLVDVKLTIMEVARPQLPELDADFAKAFGVASGDLEDLRRDVRRNMEREIRVRVRRVNTAAVMDALSQQLTFDLPENMVAQEAQALSDNMQQRLVQSGFLRGNNAMMSFVHLVQTQAKRRVKLGLIFGALAQQFDIKVTDDDLREEARDNAAAYADPEKALQWLMSQEESRAEFRALAVETKVVQAVFERAKVREATLSLTDLKQRVALITEQSNVLDEPSAPTTTPAAEATGAVSAA